MRPDKRSRAVDIRRDFYSMATSDGKDAEIQMYGDIVQERPIDWRTEEPVEGNYIVLDEFLDDLARLAGVNQLTIRLNSCGGDAYAAIPIHNRLRELKAKITVIVDGVAMSGGSLIMCAADTVRVNPSSLIMIHKCWLFLFGGYNADELRKIAESNDAVDKAQAAIYRRKTGLSEADILAMMEDETYMTGAEAVEKGFADELTEDRPVTIAASADRYTLYINGRSWLLPYPLSRLPESVPTVNPEARENASDMANIDQPATAGGNEGGTIMAKTLEELKKENPELAERLLAEARGAVNPEPGHASAATEAERQRLMEIDAIAALYDNETVREAKYGENPCTAQEMTYRAAQKAAQRGQAFMHGLEADANASGARDVGAVPGPEDAPSGQKTDGPKNVPEARVQVKSLLGEEETNHG